VNDASVWVHPPDEPDARRRGWRTGLAVLVILAVAIGVAVLRSDHRPVPGLASAAVVTASSTHRGASARDLVTSGSATAPGAVWQSAAETRGAWVQLSWPTTHQLRRMTVVRNSLDEPGMRSGFLSFGDGSFLQFSLSRSSRVTDIAFSPRPVDRVRLTASTVDPGATSVTLAEILATSRMTSFLMTWQTATQR
jgi:hypothetical protein